MRWIGQFKDWLFLKRIKYPRFTLKRWLELDSIKSDVLHKAIDERDTGRAAEAIYLYLSLALGNTTGFWRLQPWKVVLEQFYLSESANLPDRQIPMLMAKVKEEAPVGWHYTGRTWLLWTDIFASEYGWTIAEITALEIDDALGLMQEILVRRQLDREFIWATSEIAYPYNSSTKKSEFKKMPRPTFMLPSPDSIIIPKVKIKREHLPIGNVVNWEDIQKDRLN